jgi:hypothetical protein
MREGEALFDPDSIWISPIYQKAHKRLLTAYDVQAQAQGGSMNATAFTFVFIPFLQDCVALSKQNETLLWR